MVKLNKEIARWFADRILHPSQKTIENKDGSLTLSFNVAGTEEIKRWILSQGAHVKVLAPIYLRKIIKAEVKGMLGS